MAQYGRPGSDITTGWTTTPLWSKLDEVTPDDADFITGTGPTKTAEVLLSSVTDPGVHTGHVWSLRLKATGSGAGEKVSVALYQGSTSIEILVNNATIVRNAFNLWTGSLVNAANITNYGDLRIRLVTGGSNGASETIQCSWIQMEYPDPEAAQLTIQDGAHTHGADSPILTGHVPTFQLTIQDGAHTHGADSPTLTCHEPGVVLTIQDGAHNHAADSPTLTGHVPAFQLTIQDAAHFHGADQPVLIGHWILTIQDAAHSHLADSPTLIGHWILTIQDAAHFHQAENVTLTYHPPGAVVLTIADAAHSHLSDSPILTGHEPVYVLSIADASHGHSADEPVLIGHWILTIQDAAHTHGADQPALRIPSGLISDGLEIGMFEGMERKMST